MDWAATAPKRSLGETVDRRGGHLPRRPRAAQGPPSCTARPAGAPRWWWPWRRRSNPDRWRAEVAAGAPRPARAGHRGLDRPLGHMAHGAASARWGAGQEDLSGELAEGRQLLAVHGRRLKGEAKVAVREAAAVLGDSAAQDERVAAAIDPALTTYLEDSPARPELTRAEPLRVDVDRELARCGAWYELFPRSFGGFAGVERHLPQLADARLRRRLPAADPPDRRDAPQGPQQRARRRPGDPGSPWAIGARRGRAQAVHPRARHDRGFDQLVAAAREPGPRDRARLRDPVLARPPLGRRSTPSGSTAGPTARSSTPRTRPRSYQDIYQRWTSAARTGAALWRRSATWSSSGSSTACASSAWTTRTRSRSGSGSGCIRGGAGPTTPTCLPRRGVHPAEDDD